MHLLTFKPLFCIFDSTKSEFLSLIGYDIMNSTTIGHKGSPAAAMAGIVVAVVATVVATVAAFALKGEGRAMGVSGPPPVYSGVTKSDTDGVRKVSWWPYGTCYDVAYDPSTGLLVIGSGGAILLLDVSDPSRPIKVNELVLEGQHQHIVVTGGIAYVTTYRRNGLQIIDVSTPSNLRTIGFYPTEDAPHGTSEDAPHGIEIVGKTAYLATCQALDIVDISDPASPRLRSHFQVAGRAAHTYISNHKLYLTVWFEGVYVLDISNPDSPGQLGFYSSPNVALFAVTGNLALLAKWYDHTVQIFDVSDDSAFNQISTLELLDETNNPNGAVTDIVFSNSLAFISGEYWDHLQVVDLSNPYSPVIVGSINAEESTINRGQYYVGGGPIILVGNLLFQASWTCGVGIFDVSKPESIRVIGNFDTPDPYLDVSISGHIACIANQSDGLRLLDVSDPLNIKEIGSLSPGLASGTFLQVVCTDAQYAYVATEGWGVQIFDIGQPDSPNLVGSADTPGIARGIAVSNGFAYVADSEGGLRIVDVRVPNSPVEVGFCLFSASTTRVAISGGYAYVGTEDGYLQIVDVSDRTKPRVVGVFQVPGTSSFITSLTALENELYIGTNDSFVHRLDISNPISPQLKSSIFFPSGGPLEDITISQGRAYIASFHFGLRVVDVTDPVSMNEIAYYQVPGPGRGVDVAGGYIYFACDDAGLLILTTAIFNLQQYTLTVEKSGTGSGTITSSPAGINCGSDCNESYDQGTSVTLTATPAPGSTFGGWSQGGCSGTGTCVVIMNADIAVTAAFSAKAPAISVSPSSLDFGSVKIGKKITKTLKITNISSRNLVIALSGLEGTDFSIQGSSSITIKAKKSCSLKVLCTPTSAGLKTATLEIQSNDPDTPTLKISLTATLPATTPDISVAQTPIEFGGIKIGKKVTKTLKIANIGTGDLVTTFSGLEATDFSIQGSSSVTIKAKKSYSLKVLCTPTSGGLKTATLKITSNDPDTPTIDISLSLNPTQTPTVTVTNSSDVVNGDTSSVAALISNPGPDGISFREALNASNGTLGPKVIKFHPNLSGSVITFAADGDLRLLSTGGLTIDGDINGDGNPDITLDGHLSGPSGPGLSIVSSDNTITGLNFSDFDLAIAIACPDAGCGTKLFANNKIISNYISSQRGMGISITTLGFRPPEEAPLLSDITWQDTVISGNTIVTKKSTMYIDPAVGGGDRNQMINLTISGNHLSSEAEVTLDIIVADVNSAYFGIPGPSDYSDHSLIENLTITNNVIEAPYGFGIHITGANYGNSDNLLRNTRIISNTIRNIMYTGISLIAGDGGSEERGSDNNGIEDVEIRGNTITQTWVGILITGAVTGNQPGVSNNRVENVLITDNAISDYTGSGIFLMGGDSNSNEVSENLLDQIIISSNNIQQTANQGSGVGLDVRGGNSIGGISRRNMIRGLYILNNKISQSSTGVQIIGGSGTGAENNQVTIADISGNMLVGNTLASDIRDNDQGAMGNTVITLSE